MIQTRKNCRNIVFLVSLMLILPICVSAQTTFDQIVSFGASLSDPGNAFFLTGEHVKPPYDELVPFLIPPAPYAKGGNHFSNGATWIEQLAGSVGLAEDAKSAFKGIGMNYAVGGARAHFTGSGIDLSEQVGMYLNDVGGVASPDTLYILEFGGNDIRDVLVTGNPSILNDALGKIYENIYLLSQSGAKKFLVWNAPNLALSPAVAIMDLYFPGSAAAADYLTQQFNLELENIIAGLELQLTDIEIILFDANQMLMDLKSDPQAFGLFEANNACVMPGIKPYQCKNPDKYLFWDGIHPTKAVHGILAAKATYLLALPQTHRHHGYVLK